MDVLLLVAVAPVALPLALAVFAVNALAFRSPRAAFFLQERQGRNGRPFRMVKFRTMAPARDAMTSWSSGQDQLRVTRLGKLLRNTHLDELPQLWNIARGEMSFVGPRPEMLPIEAWAAERVPGWKSRDRRLRPGVTGLAQITQGYVGCDATGYARKLELNEDYLATLSLRGDLRIVLGTLLWMLRGRGWQWNASEKTKASDSAIEPSARHESAVRPRAARTAVEIPFRSGRS